MRILRRVLVLGGVLAFLFTALTAAASTVTGNALAVGKPVIGKPTTVPVRPMAGKPFAVSFRVTRADTGAPLLAGKMIFAPSVAGRVLKHVESLRGGAARLSFAVPANAGGKQLKVKLTIKSGGTSATRVATFAIQALPLPSLSIDDVSVAEGDSGPATLSFPVTLSAAATRAVSVNFATANGIAAAPSDFASASGTVTFQPGEKVKTIPIAAAGDTEIEQDETFSVVLSNPVNATVADATATGTISNDDVAVPVTAGVYQGTEGNYVFLTVSPDRTATGFRTNSLTEICEPATIILRGAVDWGTNTFRIADDGSFTANFSWSGSKMLYGAEYTHQSSQVTGVFKTPTSVTGTFMLSDELNLDGTHYRCSTGSMKWSATLQK